MAKFKIISDKNGKGSKLYIDDKIQDHVNKVEFECEATKINKLTVYYNYINAEIEGEASIIDKIMIVDGKKYRVQEVKEDE